MIHGAPIARLGLVLLLANSTACSSTRLATRWVNPEDQGPPMQRVLVMAPNARSSADRIVFERRLSRQISRLDGVEATSLFRRVPELGRVTEEQMKKTVEDGDFDGVLVVELLDLRQKVEVRESPSPYYGYGLWYRTYFYPERDRIRAYDVISLEVSLHRLPSYDLAWTGRTESVDVDSPERLADELADRVVPELQASGFLPAAGR